MKSPRPVPPVVSLNLERLKSLPTKLDTWQVGFARMPMWVTDESDEPFRPLVPICRNAMGGPIGDSELLAPGEPLAPAAITAITHLAVMKGVRCRPRQVEVTDAALADALRADLAACGIDVLVVERLEAVDEVIEDMRRQFGTKGGPPRIIAPAIDVARLRAFADAAVEFYRAAPWNDLSDEDLVEVDSAGAPAGMGCFTVLGAAGLEPGLGFYASNEQFARFMESDLDELPVTSAGSWIMSFDPPSDWPIADSEFWEAHGLPVAGEAGYPALVCLTREGSHKQARPEHLAFAEGLLRALAVTTQDELDGGRWTKVVQTFDGPLTLELSLPSILDAGAAAPRVVARPRSGLPDARRIEQTLRDVQEIMASRKFDSVDEANAFLASQVGKRPVHTPATTPRGKAQELVDRALEVEGRLRIKLAREALRLWPDCAEAWVLQAEQMPDRLRRTQLWRQGVEAGERALGPRPFAADVGHFWGILETRPYMRARHGLAGALWDADEHDEAIAHWNALLRLNPDDNQGIRLELVPRLLEKHRDAEAAALLARFGEDVSAGLLYSAVLIEFRRSGAGPAAQALLDHAMRWNPNVPRFLTGRAPMDGPIPAQYTRGSDEEARIATEVLFEAWHSTEGAVEWLGRALRPPKKQRREARAKSAGKKRK